MLENTENAQYELFSNQLNVGHGFPHDMHISVSWLMNEWENVEKTRLFDVECIKINKQTNKQAKKTWKMYANE